MTKPLHFPKSIPTTDAERTEEALEIIGGIRPTEVVKLTTWELEAVNSIKNDGRAVTRIRLKELREMDERLHHQPS